MLVAILSIVPAAAEGVAVNEEIKERVRREFPPPSYLEYRLGS